MICFEGDTEKISHLKKTTKKPANNRFFRRFRHSIFELIPLFSAYTLLYLIQGLQYCSCICIPDNEPTEYWEGSDHQYLFHKGLGSPLYFTTPTTKWSRIVEKYKLKKIRLHDLHHSMVALLMEEDNVNLPAIQKRARHSSSKITSDIYGNISKKRAIQTASQFDKYAPNKNSVNKSSPH
ncbi:tyrosine-type recombinase/integrase [Bacillus sp. N1-1]|uniref:tyrosine-type recombinase/integrase n=1 Tax=Bacillus sp. N1-1 TaxID=2682541 RepID=UPI001317718C|nr:tyrosine-type recombinase/integrase [Bacillus sp. N1-1]QHA93115.1 tyrosine-type recombinase/integrase [Bacillus sp. N1-1]